MLVPEILFESNRGIIFEKATTKNRCRMTVKNKDGGYCHMTYRFNKDVEPISSPYISWENLNCCGGWVCDDSYLLTAVQDGKKLCAGLVFNDEKERDDYRDSLPDGLMHFCRPPMHNGPHSFHYIDVVRDGAIRDYIDTDEIFHVYDGLGITNINKKLLSDLLALPMYYFISGETFDYTSPDKRPEECVVTGLMLGYPLESTAWLLEQDRMPATNYKQSDE